MSPRAYAVAHLRSVDFGDDIVRYMETIDETMAPYGGRFIVHGGRLTPLEGEWDGDLIIIEFPDQESAVAWYQSPAYQAILPLRTENADGIVTLVEGVNAGHRGVDKLAGLLAS